MYILNVISKWKNIYVQSTFGENDMKSLPNTNFEAAEMILDPLNQQSWLSRSFLQTASDFSSEQ